MHVTDLEMEVSSILRLLSEATAAKDQALREAAEARNALAEANR